MRRRHMHGMHGPHEEWLGHHGAFGPFGPPPPPMPPGPPGPWGFGGRGRGRGRRGRGDVRAAILALLAERPMHGYEMIQELEARTGGVWRPSPGSVYPTLQLLEDEDLIAGEEGEGRRRFALTDAGRAEAERRDQQAPWEQAVAGVTPAGLEPARRHGPDRPGHLERGRRRHRGPAGQGPRDPERLAPPPLRHPGRERRAPPAEGRPE